MLANVNIIFSLVVLASLASGTTKASRLLQPVTSLQSPTFGYLPILNGASPKLPQDTVFINQATDNVLENAEASDRSLREQRIQEAGYSNLKPPSSTDFKSFLNDQRIQSITDTQRSLKEVQINRDVAAIKMQETLRSRSAARLRDKAEYNPNVPRRSSYEVAEEVDEYLKNDSKQGSAYHGKVKPASPYRNSQDVTAAVRALDNFLSRVLDDDGYNSELHPPPNPVLALILSRYGRYVPGPRNPRAYAYMTVNNIHNSKPFGNYKVECEQEPTYVRK